MEPGALVDAAPAAVVVASKEGMVRFANAAAGTLYGSGPGRQIDSLVRWVDPSDPPGWRRALAIHPRRGPASVEILSFTYQDRGTEMVAHIARPPAASAADRLIGLAAHDLHEPIRIVTGYLSLVESRYAGLLDEDARQFIASAVGGAKRMETVVEGLVSLARLRSEPPSFQTCDTAACAADAVASLSQEVEARDADVRVEDLPVILADPRRLTRVFRGLLENALKFIQQPPRVRIGASRNGDAWTFSVTDNGIGIDERFRDRVFEPFTRLHPVGAYAGAGVGLAICREIVASHAGRIWVEAADGGSRFRFTIPRLTLPVEGAA